MLKEDMAQLKIRVQGHVVFDHFRDNVLWYKCEDGYIFPIPLKDTASDQGNAPIFLNSDKAIYFMRWIRKSMEKEAEGQNVE